MSHVLFLSKAYISSFIASFHSEWDKDSNTLWGIEMEDKAIENERKEGDKELKET